MGWSTSLPDTALCKIFFKLQTRSSDRWQFSWKSWISNVQQMLPALNICKLKLSTFSWCAINDEMKPTSFCRDFVKKNSSQFLLITIRSINYRVFHNYHLQQNFNNAIHFYQISSSKIITLFLKPDES